MGADGSKGRRKPDRNEVFLRPFVPTNPLAGLMFHSTPPGAARVAPHEGRAQVAPFPSPSPSSAGILGSAYGAGKTVSSVLCELSACRAR